LIGFRNPKEYKPYSLNEFAAAYYIGDEQRDYIVMSELGAERAPVAIHEYMHLLVRHSGLKMPVWLNEGFADVYSTLKPVGGQILLGSVPGGRAYVLSQEKWMPLAALLNVGPDSPEYNEKNRASIFYAQSWALAHMLILSREYSGKFSQFVAEVSAKGSSESAFSSVYGKTLSRVEKDLQAYAHSNSLRGLVFKTGFEKIAIGETRAATELEIGVTLAKLTGLLGRTDEAITRFDRLAAEHKDSYEVEEALAHLEWRRGNMDEALHHFQLAVDRGATSWKTYWDYARLLGNRTDRSAERLQALRKTVDLNPDLPDAQLMLGQELYRKHSYAQALVALRTIKNIDAERAAPLFLMIAYSAAELGNTDEAKRNAEQARKYAREPELIASAAQLSQYLERQAAHASAPPPVVLPSESGSAPVLRRQEETGTTETPVLRPRPVYATLQGNLVQLDCLDGMARMHIRAGGSAYTLLIRKPDQIAIRNTDGVSVNMTCGPQDTPISVEYTPGADAKYGTSGDIRTLEFLSPH
jgi:tetratricopeptide (TPR) repeat protein